jgi:hypothetical protein
MRAIWIRVSRSGRTTTRIRQSRPLTATIYAMRGGVPAGTKSLSSASQIDLYSGLICMSVKRWISPKISTVESPATEYP